MGLIGYINDEIQRRSKEIAIRKVNGAEASSILRLFSKDIFWISLPAVFLGGLGAWYIGGVWIEQFVEEWILVSADSCLLHALYYCSSSVV